MCGLCGRGTAQPQCVRNVGQRLSNGQHGRARIRARRFLDARDTRNAHTPETYNNAMDTYAVRPRERGLTEPVRANVRRISPGGPRHFN